MSTAPIYCRTRLQRLWDAKSQSGNEAIVTGRFFAPLAHTFPDHHTHTQTPQVAPIAGSALFIGNAFCVVPGLEKASVAAVFTSPPYNLGPSPKLYDPSFADELPSSQFVRQHILLFHEYDRLLEKNGLVMVNLSYSDKAPSLPSQLVVNVEVRWLRLSSFPALHAFSLRRQ